MAVAGGMKPSTKPSLNPFHCGGTPLPVPLLLTAKLIALAVILTFEWRALPDPFLPFLPIFDRLGSGPLFRWGLEAAVLFSAGALLLNRWVRPACLVMGSAFLVGILASRAFFSNNRMFVGCILFLIGLYEPRTGPWLVRLQVALVYLGASLNKLLDADWRSGQFFSYWSSIYVKEILYFRVASWLPHLMLARLLSWTTMVGELALSAGFLLRRLRVWAIWGGLLFHATLSILTHRTFGLFTYAMPACYLAFVAWPQAPLTVLYDGDCGFCARTRRLLERFDLENVFAWTAFQKSEERYGIPEEDLRQRMYVVAGSRKYAGFAAFKAMALYNPVTYFILLFVLVAPQPDFFPYRPWVMVLLLALFSPVFSPVGEAVYKLVARNRHRLSVGQSCAVAVETDSEKSALRGAGLR